MSDASVWGVLGFHSRKREEDDRKTEARPMPSRREVRDYSDNLIKKLKGPQTGGSPDVFFAREDENSGQGQVQKKERGVDRSISEGGLMTSFGDRRGGSLKEEKLKPPQTGRSPGDFFAKQDNNMYQEELKKKKQEGTRASQRGSKEQVQGPVEVVL